VDTNQVFTVAGGGSVAGAVFMAVLGYFIKRRELKDEGEEKRRQQREQWDRQQEERWREQLRTDREEIYRRLRETERTLAESRENEEVCQRNLRRLGHRLGNFEQKIFAIGRRLGIEIDAEAVQIEDILEELPNRLRRTEGGDDD
jgi:hypothetical protein